MNYEKIYDALVEKAKPRGLDKSQHEGYFEIHHIVPRCMGGTDEESNLIMLSCREHFIAHLLLWKIYPEVQGLLYAAFMMSYRGQVKTSRIYEKMRLSVSNLVYKRNYGKLKVDYTGTKIGRLTVLSYDLEHSVKGRRCPKWECLCECGSKTFVATANLRRKRILSCGCLALEVRRDRLLGKQKSSEMREKISKSLKNKNINPWETNNLDHKGKLKWCQAAVYYDFWSKYNKPSAHNMAKVYNKEFGTSLTRSYFKVLVGRFSDGWVPSEDQVWLKFKEDYEKTERGDRP